MRSEDEVLSREPSFTASCMHSQGGGQLSKDGEVGEIFQVIFCHQCPKLPHAVSGVVLCFDNFIHQSPLLSSLFRVDEGLGSYLVVLCALCPFVGLLMPIVGNKQL